MPQAQAPMPDEELKRREEWIALLNGHEETRIVVFYILAVMFLHPAPLSGGGAAG
jgi:hypothetical protein